MESRSDRVWQHVPLELKRTETGIFLAVNYQQLVSYSQQFILFINIKSMGKIMVAMFASREYYSYVKANLYPLRTETRLQINK